MTLRQIALVIEGEADRRHEQYRLAYYTAWHSGLFSQQYAKGKFPKYERGEPKRKQAKTAQTWQQQKAFVMALNAAMGGTFSKRQTE